jgi:PAS domain S-box-containing protein
VKFASPKTWIRPLPLRPRLLGLVLLSVAPFIFLIAMVARQHRMNEREDAEAAALDQAGAIAARIDSRFGSVETLLLTLVHSVSPDAKDSLRNDKLLREVVAELPEEFAHFAVLTPAGAAIGTSDTLQSGKRNPILLSTGVADTALEFDIHGPAPLYGNTGPLGLAVSHLDSTLRVRVVGVMMMAQLQKDVSRNELLGSRVTLIADRRGTVILRSPSPGAWVGRNIAGSPLFQSVHGRRAGVAATRDLEGRDVFTGYVTARHVPWIVATNTPQSLAFAKQRADFWRAIDWGALALVLAMVLAWTQATRIAEVLTASLNAMSDTLDKREETLRLNEMRFRALIENVGDIILIASPEGVRRYVSPAMSRVLGYSEAELLAFTAEDMIDPADWPGVRELIREVQQMPGATASGQARYRHRNGSWLTMEISLSNLIDVPGVDGIVVNLRDVTEQVALESELRQAQKMESVGQLAGGVAHDFNNLLTVISGRVDFLLESRNLDSDQASDLGEIKKAGERATELTRQLLAFSRKQLLQPRVVDLNRMVAEVEPMLRRLFPEDINIRIELGEDLGSITADPGQLQQILLNLALNARDAMPSGGTLTFRTENTTHRGPTVHHDTQITPGEYVMLQVGDTGVGMDAATRLRIFEPFFTTKGQGKGTGLGLSTVYGIVKQSGAVISVSSAPREGTTFCVYFPRTDGFALAQSAERGEVSPLSGSETILLVEDDSSVRNLVERVLTSRGYNVLAAQHGSAALSLAANRERAVDLVLTDIVMPAMSGRQLVEALQLEHPQLRVLYMSGYTDDEVLRRGLHDPGTSFIQKPFTAENLATQVRKVLDAA